MVLAIAEGSACAVNRTKVVTFNDHFGADRWSRADVKVTDRAIIHAHPHVIDGNRFHALLDLVASICTTCGANNGCKCFAISIADLITQNSTKHTAGDGTDADGGVTDWYAVNLTRALYSGDSFDSTAVCADIGFGYSHWRTVVDAIGVSNLGRSRNNLGGCCWGRNRRGSWRRKRNWRSCSGTTRLGIRPVNNQCCGKRGDRHTKYRNDRDQWFAVLQAVGEAVPRA